MTTAGWLGAQVAAVAELAGMQTGEPHDGQLAAALWGWEPRLQARDVLQALVKSQRDVLHAVSKGAAASVSALSAIAI
jgi:hypothetical protein